MKNRRLLVLLGHPVGHSLSPAFQNAALEALGVPMAYIAFDVAPSLLGDAIKGLRALGFLGGNVTVPHKIDVIQHLDGLSPEASRIGAVNTIVSSGGQLEGHNTDARGLVNALQDVASFSPRGRRALLVGAGGAGRAAAFGLLEAGCSHLTIVNRTLSSAEGLASDLKGHGHDSIDAVWLEEAPWEEVLGSCDLLVNATTLGMGNAGTVLPEEIDWPKDLIVCDLVYGLKPTPLETLARSKGLTTVPGTAVLLHQGALSFSLWTGREAPVEIMRKVIEKVRDLK